MYNNEERIARNKLILIIATFGTIGVMSHFIPLSSAGIVFYRALLGGLFIIAVNLLSKNKIHLDVMKNNIFLLILTGIGMSLNWVLQFEAFKVSSVSVGTVAYNTMPIFVIILSPFLFKNKISLKSKICVLIALIGIILVSNVLLTGIKSSETLGVVYGLMGAFFYAFVVLLNKKLSHIETHDKIIFQFLFSALVMLIYTMINNKNGLLFYENIDKNTFIVGLISLLIISFIHTGLCYVAYFNACLKLKPDTIAILTYIDPVVALLLSHFILNERLNIYQILGAILILLSTIINEFVK